jgi:hypothetical protein
MLYISSTRQNIRKLNFVVSWKWPYCSSYEVVVGHQLKSIHVWYCMHLRLILSGHQIKEVYYEAKRKKVENNHDVHTQIFHARCYDLTWVWIFLPLVGYAPYCVPIPHIVL